MVEPGVALDLAASSIRPTVRLSLKSKRLVKTPTLPRSGGISVRLSQPPLAYWSKLSPGLTEASMLATTMPWVSCWGAPIGAFCGRAESKETARRAQIAVCARKVPEDLDVKLIA